MDSLTVYNPHSGCSGKFVLGLFLERRDPADFEWIHSLAMKFQEQTSRVERVGEMKEFLNCDLGDRIAIAETGGEICSWKRRLCH